MDKTQKDAMIGAAAGGLGSGVIGHQSGSTTKGVLIGAVLGGAGGAGGAGIGSQMDKQAEELKQNIPGATVERMGEGIRVTCDSGVLFDSGSSALLGGARHNMDQLATSLTCYPNTTLLIIGPTDNVGSPDANMNLSLRRSETAAHSLTPQGVQRPIATRGMGETEPVASNETSDGRQSNRRVEVAIDASDKYAQGACRQGGGQ